MHLRPSESVSAIKELISTFSGIQSPKIRLLYKNKPICDSVSINTIPNDTNIVAMLPILSGITLLQHVTCAITSQGTILVLIVVKFIAKIVR